jgi:hypothetical protein
VFVVDQSCVLIQAAAKLASIGGSALGNIMGVKEETEGGEDKGGEPFRLDFFTTQAKLTLFVLFFSASTN